MDNPPLAKKLYLAVTGANCIPQLKNIGVTGDKITGRGGLAFFLRYLEKISIFQLLERRIGFLRKSVKGQKLCEVTKQIIAYFVDGSHRSISGFDELRRDESYAALLEEEKDSLIGSDIVKRFFRKFLGRMHSIFRPLLHLLFVWRLKREKPDLIALDIDTMVLNNDDALRREGVEPTYKSKKGFQVLNVSWGGYIVDSLFRSGSKHSNYGNDVSKIMKKLVGLIRKHYSKEIPIILTCDSGFLDQKIFRYFENELGIYYICVGKLYDDITRYVGQLPRSDFKEFEGEHSVWGYCEFGNKLKSWGKYRRAIYTTLICEDEQLLLEFARPDTLLYTNIGQSPELDERLIQAGYGEYMSADKIIELAHSRGCRELNHRSFKDFMGTEHLPFKRFGMNGAYYYMMLISHFLFESYKRDVCEDVIPVTSYPTTFRRRLIDFACKIIETGRSVTLKVTRMIWETLKIEVLWERCNNPVPIWLPGG